MPRSLTAVIATVALLGSSGLVLAQGAATYGSSSTTPPYGATSSDPNMSAPPSATYPPPSANYQIPPADTTYPQGTDGTHSSGSSDRAMPYGQKTN
jgi:hypothetical protein